MWLWLVSHVIETIFFVYPSFSLCTPPLLCKTRIWRLALHCFTHPVLWGFMIPPFSLDICCDDSLLCTYSRRRNKIGNKLLQSRYIQVQVYQTNQTKQNIFPTRYTRCKRPRSSLLLIGVFRIKISVSWQQTIVSKIHTGPGKWNKSNQKSLFPLGQCY